LIEWQKTASRGTGRRDYIQETGGKGLRRYDFFPSNHEPYFAGSWGEKNNPSQRKRRSVKEKMERLGKYQKPTMPSEKGTGGE